MRKQTIIFTLIAIVIIFGGLLGWYFFLSGSDTQAERSERSFFGLFPFGGGRDDGFPDGGGDIDDRSGLDDADGSVPLLRQISATAVAGFVVFEEGEKTVIRFIERETGNIFEATTDSVTLKRISNTTIPRIQEALWMVDGESLIIRYLDGENESIETFYAKLTESEDLVERSLEGEFLTNDIKTPVISAGNRMFYLIENTSGITGITADPDGSKKVQIFNSPLKEWLAQWPGGNIIALTTKASSDVGGFLYFLNSQTERFDKVLGNIPGLTTLVSPDRENVLYSESLRGNFILNSYNIDKETSVALAVRTLPEKCIWSKDLESIIYCGIPKQVPNDEYPDVWYQGLTTFNDTLWEIDTETETANILIDPLDFAGVEIDAIKPLLSPNEDNLLFINKKDLTLWSLRLK